MWDVVHGAFVQEIERQNSRLPYIDFCQTGQTRCGLVGLVDGKLDVYDWKVEGD